MKIDIKSFWCVYMYTIMQFTTLSKLNKKEMKEQKKRKKKYADIQLSCGMRKNIASIKL